MQANIAVSPECAGFGVVDVFGPAPNAAIEPTDLDRGSSMDHLLRAAKMASEDNEASEEDEDNLTLRHQYNLSNKKEEGQPKAASNPAWEYMKLASQKAKQLKPGKNDSSLVDDSDDDDIPKVITHPQVDMKPAASLERKSAAMVSEETKKPSKQGMKLKSRKDDTSSSKDSNSGVNMKPSSSSKRKRKSEEEDVATAEKDNKPPAKRKSKNTTAGKSLSSSQSTISTEPSAPAAAPAQPMAVARVSHLSNSGPSIGAPQFDEGNPPLPETALLNGQSLTLSEVSWGRDICFGGGLKSAAVAEDVGDGQFDDPEDE